MIACVLRSGGDFKPSHVQWLASQVPDLVCLSDVDIPGVKTIPLKTNWPGWWAKMEMFGPSLEGDVLMIDLDTVVFRVPKADKTTVLTDFYHPELIGSGLMYVTAEDRRRVWEAFTTDPHGHMDACKKWPKHGDQGFLMDYLGGADRWQRVYSYKVHCKDGPPKDADVVCFHGQPRPWQVAASWIPRVGPRTIGDLLMKHAGQRICVLGGGPSMAVDLASVKADVWISANEHGAKVRPVDYMVAMDPTHTTAGVEMKKYLRQYSDAPILGPWGVCEWQILKWPMQPKFILSGIVAAWIGSLMGSHPLILCGFDCYGGQPRILEQHKWYLPHIHGEVRVTSGPLVGMYQQYDPKERRKSYKKPPSLDAENLTEGEIIVQVRKPFFYAGSEWPVGAKIRVSKYEVSRQLKHKSLIEV